MPFRTIGRIAFRDLGRNRRRTVLSMVAVALGLALLIILNGLVGGVMADAMQSAIRLQSGHVQVRASGYGDDSLSLRPSELLSDPGAVLDRAEALDGVAAAAPVLWAGAVLATAQESENLRLVGIDPSSEVFAPFRDGLVAGEMIEAGDRTGILLGRRLADSLGIAPGQRVSLGIAGAEGQLEQGAFLVRGLFTTGIPTLDEGAVFMPLDRAQSFAGVGNRASAVMVLLDDPETAPAVAAALAGPGQEARTWRELNAMVLQSVETAMGFYVILDLIVMLVVAVVIANTLLMVVFERVREVGILASLGMRSRQILTMFLVEAALLGLAGIVVGIGLGLAGVAYLAVVGIPIGDVAAATTMAIGTTMRARFLPDNIVWLSAWTLLIILLAAVYPAWFAARLSPAAALHRN